MYIRRYNKRITLSRRLLPSEAGRRFYHRHHCVWHDAEEKQRRKLKQPHESIPTIVSGDGHVFYWKKQPKHLRFYLRLCLRWETEL